MKRIIFDEITQDEIRFSEIADNVPIFAKKNGILCGMIVWDAHAGLDGWVLMIGSSHGATGYHPSLKECLESCVEDGYTFYVE